jgi:2-isopropylmalate synthase
MFGRKQEILIGFMSGASNVSYYLRERGVEPDDALVKEILAAAKALDHIMTEEEVMSVVKRARP